jgi:signal transduction histidine kinase
MKKIKNSFVFAILLPLLVLAPCPAFPNGKIKTIVVFFGMFAGMPSYQNILDGFRSSIPDDPENPYNILVEYLDAGRSSDDEYVKHIVGMYNQKLKNIHIDLLVTIPPYTYSLLKKYKLEVLETTPTLKLEMDPPVGPTSADPLNKNTLEIKVTFNAVETFRHAFELFPDHKEVYIISGTTPTDLYFTSQVRESVKRFTTTHKFTFVSGITLDSTIQTARQIPPNSIVFIPIYLSDVNNVPFSTPEVIGMISNNCNAPVFPIFDSFIKSTGGIGGYVFSYIYLGKETGRIATEILEGKPISKITVNKASFYQHIYDWKQLKKWGLLDSDLIPANSIFYNRETDFLYDHRWQLLAVLFLLLSESILIVYLVKLNKRQKETAKQKEETESLYRTLVREDRLSTMVELTASLSHELNQPLTAILYSAQAGKRFLESEKLDRAQASEIFENIIEDDKRAAGLISSVKSLMKLETRVMEKVDLNALIQDTVHLFHAEGIKQQIQVKVSLPQDPVYVFGDKIQLQQVILNFINNGAIAMEHVIADKKILEIIQQANTDSVSVSVRDSGPGIDEAMKDKLFKPFMTTRVSGFGIGLAVSRSIIERHNGKVWANNLPGGGAEFSFRLQILADE